MKTKRFLQLAVILVSAIALTLTSCAKEDFSPAETNTESLKQLSADENDIENVMNDAISDVAGVISNDGGNLKSTAWLPCNATVDSMAVVNDTVTMYITYNGLNCSGTRNRTGKIEIKKKFGTKWYEAGATVIYRYINFTVTRVATNNSITLNGTKTFVNVSGGLRWMVGNFIDSYVEKVSGTMQASFNNGASRTWNVARQLTYTGAPGAMILTADGFGSAGEYNNLVVWGTNREGEQFYTQITQSVVFKEVCESNPVSGIKIHQIPSDNKSATITFGYDDNNLPVTGDTCPTRYRIDWQQNNQSGTMFLPL